MSGFTFESFCGVAKSCITKYRDEINSKEKNVIYTSWYKTFFYENMYQALTCDYVFDDLSNNILYWLYQKEDKMLDFLYEEFIDTDCNLSDNFDDCIAFINEIYDNHVKSYYDNMLALRTHCSNDLKKIKNAMEKQTIDEIFNDSKSNYKFKFIYDFIFGDTIEYSLYIDEVIYLALLKTPLITIARRLSETDEKTLINCIREMYNKSIED